LEEIQYYSYCLFEGVAFLHLSGIIHRDLKPENLLCDDVNLKITDFGYATPRWIDWQTALGTPLYMAPEMVLGDLHRTSCDMWSCGCILFEMLCGNPLVEYDKVKEQNIDGVVERLVEILGPPPSYYSQLFKYPYYNQYFVKATPEEGLRHRIRADYKEWVDLVEMLLKWHPKQRAYADEILMMPHFDIYRTTSGSLSRNLTFQRETTSLRSWRERFLSTMQNLNTMSRTFFLACDIASRAHIKPEENPCFHSVCFRIAECYEKHNLKHVSGIITSVENVIEFKDMAKCILKNLSFDLSRPLAYDYIKISAKDEVLRRIATSFLFLLEYFDIVRMNYRDAAMCIYIACKKLNVEFPFSKSLIHDIDPGIFYQVPLASPFAQHFYNRMSYTHIEALEEAGITP
jgi:serine/threonine protein kinase